MDNTIKYYNYLKSVGGVDLPASANSFALTMKDPFEASKYYDYLKGLNKPIDIAPDRKSFVTTLNPQVDYAKFESYYNFMSNIEGAQKEQGDIYGNINKANKNLYQNIDVPTGQVVAAKQDKDKVSALDKTVMDIVGVTPQDLNIETPNSINVKLISDYNTKRNDAIDILRNGTSEDVVADYYDKVKKIREKAAQDKAIQEQENFRVQSGTNTLPYRLIDEIDNEAEKQITDLKSLYTESLLPKISQYNQKGDDYFLKATLDQIKDDLYKVGNSQLNQLTNVQKFNKNNIYKDQEVPVYQEGSGSIVKTLPAVDNIDKGKFVFSGGIVEAQQVQKSIKDVSDQLNEKNKELSQKVDQFNKNPLDTSLRDEITAFVNDEIKPLQAQLKVKTQVLSKIGNVINSKFTADYLKDTKEQLEIDKNFDQLGVIGQNLKGTLYTFVTNADQVAKSVKGVNLMEDQLMHSTGLTSDKEFDLNSFYDENSMRKGLGYKVPQKLYSFQAYKDGKLDYGMIFPSMVGTTTQMAVMAAATFVAGPEALPGIAGNFLGAYVGGSLMFGGVTLENELNNGLTLQQAIPVTQGRMLIEAATEIIFPENLAWFKGAKGVPGSLLTKLPLFNRIFTREAMAEIAPKVFGNTWKSAIAKLGTKALYGAATGVEIAGKETLEELVADPAHKGFDVAIKSINPDYVQQNQFSWENELGTAINTMISMGLSGAYSGFKAARYMPSAAYYRVGQAPDYYNNIAKLKLDQSVLTPEEHKDLVANIQHISNDYASVKDNIDALETYGEKVDYFGTLTSRNALINKLATLTDENEIKSTQNQINKFDEKIAKYENLISKHLNLKPDEYQQKLVEAIAHNFATTYSEDNIKGIANLEDLNIKSQEFYSRLTNNRNNARLMEQAPLYMERFNKRREELTKVVDEPKPGEGPKPEEPPKPQPIEAQLEAIKKLPKEEQIKQLSKLQRDAVVNDDDETADLLGEELKKLKEVAKEETKKTESQLFIESLKTGDSVNVKGKEWTVKTKNSDGTITLEDSNDPGTTTKISQPEKDIRPYVEDVEEESDRTRLDRAIFKAEALKGDIEANIKSLQPFIDSGAATEDQTHQYSESKKLLKSVVDQLEVLKNTQLDEDNYQPDNTQTFDEEQADDIEKSKKLKEQKDIILEPARSANAFRTMGVVPNAANLQDPTALTAFATLSRLKSEHEATGVPYQYKVMLITTKKLIEKLFGRTNFDFTNQDDVNLLSSQFRTWVQGKEEADVAYWKNNPEAFKKEIEQETTKRVVIVSNNGDIVYFDTSGNQVDKGRIAVYSVPTEHTLTTKLKPSEKQLNTGNNRKIWTDTLEQLKKFRENKETVITDIDKISDGVGIDESYGNVDEYPSIGQFALDLGESAITVRVSKDTTVSTKRGGAYAIIKGQDFEIARPTLAQNVADAIINLAKNNEDYKAGELEQLKAIDSNLQEWEARKAYIQNITSLNSHGERGINLVQSKTGPIFILSSGFVNSLRQYPEFKGLKTKKDGALILSPVKDAELLKLALTNKRYNVAILGDVDTFNFITFSNGFQNTPYNSYKEWALSNLKVYAKVNPDYKLLLEKGIDAVPSQYMTFVYEEKVPEPKPKIEEIDDQVSVIKPDYFEDLDKFTRSRLYTENITPEQDREAEEWFKNSPLSKFISVQRYKNLVNSDAYAKWTQGIITLYQGATNVDLYHEAWHDFSQLYLTPRQKTLLYNELRERKGDVTFAHRGVVITKKFSNLTNIEAEEVIAEEFRQYALSGGKEIFKAPVKNTIFHKIWNLFKSLLDSAFNTGITLEQYFDKLYVHDINKYKRNLHNQAFSELHRSIKYGENVIGTKLMNEFNNLIDGIMAEVLQKKGKTSAIFTKGVKDKQTLTGILYRGVKGEIEYKLSKLDKNSEDYKDLKILYDNFDPKPKNSGYTKEEEEGYAKGVHSKQSQLFKDVAFILDPEDAKREEEQELAEQSGKEAEVDYAESNSFSGIEKASEQMLFLLSTLQKYYNGKPVFDRWGFPANASMDVSWYKLSQEIKGLTDPDQIYKRIEKLGEKYPEFNDLVQRLPALQQEHKLKDIVFLQDFIKTFSKPFVPMYEAILSKDMDGKVTFRNLQAGNSAIKSIKDIFSANFKDLPVGEFISKDENDNNFLNVKAIQERFGVYKGEEIVLTGDYNKRIEFLDALGAVFSDVTLNSDEFKKVVNDQNILNYLFTGLLKREKAGIKITDPFKDLSVTKDQSKYGEEAGNVDKVLNTEVEATNEYFTDSVKNPNGDLVYQFQNPSKVTYIYEHLNNSELYPTYQEILKQPEFKWLDINKNPAIKSSLWLNSLFNLDVNSTNFGKRRVDQWGNIITIKNVDVGGMKFKSEDSTISSNKTTSLSVYDKIIYDLNAFGENGLMPHMRAGDKSSEKGTIVRYQNGSFYPLRLEAFKSTFIPQQVVSVMTDHLRAEIASIALYNKIPEGTVKWYNTDNKRGAGFRIFDDILTQEQKDLLLSSPDAINTFDLKSALEQFFSREVNKLKLRLQKIPGKIKDTPTQKYYGMSNFLDLKSGIVNLKGLSYASFLNAFYINNYLYNIEQLLMINGDLAMFKNNTDFHKRLSADSANGDLGLTNKYIRTFIENTGHVQAGILREKGFDIPKRVEDGTFNSAIFNDVIVRSEYTKIYLNEFTKGLNLDVDVLLNSTTEDLNKKLEGIDKSKVFEIKSIIAKYNDITEADALGMCTLDFYRNIKITLDDWDDKAENAYIKAITGQTLTSDELYYFNPLKLQYSGPIDIDEKTLNNNYLRVEAFDKFAIIPLIPQAIQGTNLEKFNENLLKQGIDYSLFESGSKKSAITKEGKFNDFYSGEFDPAVSSSRVLNQGQYTINKKFLPYLKKQLYIAPEIKDENIFSTQFNKLWAIDLFEDGNAVNEKVGKEHARYIRNRTQLVQNELNKVLRQLQAITKQNPDGTIDYKITNFAGLAQILDREFTQRNLPDNLRDFLDVDKNGKLKYNLDSSLSREKMNSTLLAIVNNRIIREKFHGDNYIQTAFTGWETDSKLKFYEPIKDKEGNVIGVKPAEVKVSIAKFKNLLNLKWKGQLVGTRERLNELIKDEEFLKEHGKKLRIVGVRIPTQGANSMLNAQVVEFMPESFGNTIILPTEITAQTGSDFDIDKLSIYIPNLTIKGELHVKKRTNKEIWTDIKEEAGATLDFVNTLDSFTKMSVNKYIDTLTEEIRYTKEEFLEKLNEFVRIQIAMLATDDVNKHQLEKANYFVFLEDIKLAQNSLYDYYNELESNDRAYLQNEIMDSLQNMLSSPEMFEALVTPNSNDILEPLAREMSAALKQGRKITMSNVIGYAEQLNQFEANLVGKSTLGIAAVHNTFNQLFKQVGMYINNPNAIKLKHNTIVVDGKERISLGKVFDANGEYKISQIISQAINGYVDVAKDAWIFLLNFTYEAAPVFFYLNHAGVPIRSIVYLMNQPIIRQYLEYKKMSRLVSGQALNELYEYDGKNKQRASDKLTYQLLHSYTPTIKGNLHKKLTELKKRKEYLSNSAFTEENLASSIKENKNFKTLSDSEKLSQAVILAHFLELEDGSQHMRNLQTATRFDARKIKSTLEAHRTEDMYLKVLEDGFFPADRVTKMKKNSVISMLDMNPLVTNLYPQFYKVVEHKKLNRFIANVFADVKFQQKDVFESRFKNEFINFIFNTMGEYPEFNENNIPKLLENTQEQLPEVNKTWYNKFWEYVNRGTYQKFIRDLETRYSTQEIDGINKEIRNVYIQELKQKYPQLGNIILQEDNSTLQVENEQILKDLEPTFTRLMVGNHGIYVEFDTPKNKGTFVKERKQYREYNRKGSKLYDQFATVNYADYKAGKWYEDINDYNLSISEPVKNRQGLIYPDMLPLFKKGTSMAEKFQKFKKDYPKLTKEFDILTLLATSTSKYNKDLRNLTPKKYIKNTKDINILTEELQKGLEYNNPEYNTEQIKEIRSFFQQLVYFGFAQSGIQKSNIGYSQFLPYEQISPIIDKKLPFIRTILDSDVGNKLLSFFYHNYFMLNNPTLFKRTALRGAGLVGNEGQLKWDDTNREGNRIKKFKPIPGSLLTFPVNAESEVDKKITEDVETDDVDYEDVPFDTDEETTLEVVPELPIVEETKEEDNEEKTKGCEDTPF